MADFLRVVDASFDQVRNASSAAHHLVEDTPEHGGGGGMSEDWKQSVDRRLEVLHSDVRDLLRGGIAAAVAAAALIAGLYFYVNQQVDDINDKVVAMQVAQTKTDGRIELVNAKLDTLLERTKPDR